MRRSGLCLLLLVASVAACGFTGDAAVPSAPPPAVPDRDPTADASRSGASALVITVGDGSGTTTTWQLTCDPPGGSHPDPAAACAALERNGATALPPVPKDRMCTQRFGGPAEASVTGTWRGQAVRSGFSLVNGCEIARWRALEGLLPPAEV